MALAEIHGKMPFIYSEDLLTADVFAAFKYLPADSGILAFLHSIDGLNGLLRPLQAGDTVTCTYHFWPIGLERRREPDVLLEISIEERIYHIVVEAKYYSGPSDKEIEEIELDGDVYQVGNQLADQLRDLYHGEYRIFRQGLRHRRISLLSEVNDRFLIYLTAHNTKPRTELDRATTQYPIGQRKLFWANWSQVYEHFQQMRRWVTTEPASLILQDICLLLERKGFASFHGFRPMPMGDLDPASASFWRDRSPDEPAFKGIRPPPSFSLEPTASKFWKGD